MGRSLGVTLALALGAGGCAGELPARGEAILIVDTDLPVPQIASALRLDLYTIDPETGGAGRWYASRTVALPDRRDWPVSFSIFNPADLPQRTSLVRLRVYPRDRERDYHGERFLPPPPADLPPDSPYRPPEPGGGEEPRLEIDGRDLTPSAEPEPSLTVDRLFRLRLTEGEVGSLRVSLHGDCVGTMADIAGARSCVDEEKALEPLAELTPDEETAVDLAVASAVGSFGQSAGCSRPARSATATPEGEPFFDDEICVPGGAFIFGNAEAFGIGSASGVPERVAVLPAFFIDRYEVTVRRIRRAYLEGFDPADGGPVPNDLLEFDDSIGPDDPRFCTYNPAPGIRDDFPVNCVSHDTARAFCQFYGGDLPTEAQWEYVAQVAGRSNETPYPWGDEGPRCETVVFARVEAGLVAFTGGNQCATLGVGPVSVSQDGGDQSLGLGVFGLGGNLQEHMRDDFLPLDTALWAAMPLRSPQAQIAETTATSVRGGTWGAPANVVYPGIRSQAQPGSGNLVSSNTLLGFRCVWPDVF